jgi:hypothetical protein
MADENPVIAALRNIDMSKVTEDQVILDIIEQSRQFAVRMSVASTLLDLLRADAEKPESPGSQSPEHVVVS